MLASMVSKLMKWVTDKFMDVPAVVNLLNRLKTCADSSQSMKVLKCSGGEIDMNTNKCRNGGDMLCAALQLS